MGYNYEPEANFYVPLERVPLLMAELRSHLERKNASRVARDRKPLYEVTDEAVHDLFWFDWEKNEEGGIEGFRVRGMVKSYEDDFFAVTVLAHALPGGWIQNVYEDGAVTRWQADPFTPGGGVVTKMKGQMEPRFTETTTLTMDQVRR